MTNRSRKWASGSSLSSRSASARSVTLIALSSCAGPGGTQCSGPVDQLSQQTSSVVVPCRHGGVGVAVAAVQPVVLGEARQLPAAVELDLGQQGLLVLVVRPEQGTELQGG